jgi:hypothetical protein
MMAAAYPGTETVEALDSNVLRRVLDKEAGRRRESIADADLRRRMENLATLATLVGGLLPRFDSFTYLQHTDIALLLPDMMMFDTEGYRAMVGGGGDESSLAGIQPDIRESGSFLIDWRQRAALPRE